MTQVPAEPAPIAAAAEERTPLSGGTRVYRTLGAWIKAGSSINITPLPASAFVRGGGELVEIVAENGNWVMRLKTEQENAFIGGAAGCILRDQRNQVWSRRRDERSAGRWR